MSTLEALLLPRISRIQDDDCEQSGASSKLPRCLHIFMLPEILEHNANESTGQRYQTSLERLSLSCILNLNGPQIATLKQLPAGGSRVVARIIRIQQRLDVIQDVGS